MLFRAPAPSWAPYQSHGDKTFHSEAAARWVEEARKGAGLVAAGGCLPHTKKKLKQLLETQGHTVSPRRSPWQSPAAWVCRGLETHTLKSHCPVFSGHTPCSIVVHSEGVCYAVRS